jgi:hypothetical protein
MSDPVATGNPSMHTRNRTALHLRSDMLEAALVLVQHGMVVGQYTDDQTAEAANAAKRLERAGARPVMSYEVGKHLPQPPRAGTDVDPDELRWTRLR